MKGASDLPCREEKDYVVVGSCQSTRMAFQLENSNKCCHVSEIRFRVAWLCDKSKFL